MTDSRAGEDAVAEECHICHRPTNEPAGSKFCSYPHPRGGQLGASTTTTAEQSSPSSEVQTLRGRVAVLEAALREIASTPSRDWHLNGRRARAVLAGGDAVPPEAKP